MSGSVPQRLEAIDMGRRAIQTPQIQGRYRSGDRPSAVHPYLYPDGAGCSYRRIEPNRSHIAIPEANRIEHEMTGR